MAKKLPSISHNEFASVIRDKQAAEALIKQHDKAAREARKALSVADATLAAAMGKHALVQCGDLALEHETSDPVPGAITLTDDSKIPLPEIEGFVARGRMIEMKNIKTLFGGRSGSDKITIRSAA